MFHSLLMVTFKFVRSFISGIYFRTFHQLKSYLHGQKRRGKRVRGIPYNPQKFPLFLQSKLKFLLKSNIFIQNYLFLRKFEIHSKLQIVFDPLSQFFGRVKAPYPKFLPLGKYGSNVRLFPLFRIIFKLFRHSSCRGKNN